MKRRFRAGLTAVLVMATLVGCAGQSDTSLSTSEAAMVERFKQQYAGVEALVIKGCAAKLQVDIVDDQQDISAIHKCVGEHFPKIGESVMSRVDAGEIPVRDAGDLMLDQAVTFFQAYSANARAQDPAKLKADAISEAAAFSHRDRASVPR